MNGQGCDMKKKINYLIYMLIIMCFALIISGCADNTATSTEEQKASDEEVELNDLRKFTAVSSADEKITQSYFEDYDVTIVNIWATFCPPCLDEMPDIAELDSTRPDNIGMLLICTDALAEPDYMQEILDEAGFKGINLVRGDGDFAKVIGAVQFVPTTVFVNSEGKLVGEPVVGESMNPKMTYYKHINAYLKEIGLETVG